MDQVKFLIAYVRSAHKSEEGATIVEYSLLVGLIAVALIAGLGLLRTDIEALLTKITTAI
jgi:pilus assembly protein Flp/PilA